ncbi:MAG TPA: hypothetical protein VGF17_13430 [Phytomonospora sp.]
MTTVSNLSELHKKTNTEVMVGLKRKTEELSWFDDLPDLKLIPSGNEMRLVLDVTYQPDTAAMIPDGGYEAVQTTQAPSHGTVSFVQMNARYSFSTLYQAFEKKGRAGMIQKNVTFSAVKAIENFARKIGLQTYGSSTGTKAVVKTTGSAGAVQTGIALKNAFGSSLVPGSATADQTYLSTIFRVGDPVAIIRSSAIVEFGSVVASPSTGSGVGFIDITFNSSITPTANDLIVAAAAVTGNTIAETDTGRWPVGMFDVIGSGALHGLSGTGNQWNVGYSDTTGGRMSFVRKEALANALWNQGGVKMNRMIWSQGVRRDAIAGERGSMVYESSSTNLDGDIGVKGVKDYTSVLAPTGLVFGWNNEVLTKKALSDLPDYESGPSIFELDKIQDKGAYSASFNYVYLKACTNRSGVGYLSSLQEQ